MRVAGWNALLIVAGLALIAVAGELWLRSIVPFMTSIIPRAFVPGVGLLGKPGAEVRKTNRLDYWQISRFNRHGFLDREPPIEEPATAVSRPPAACHVTVIGDSFVEAREVAIADKLHVRLEALAAQRLRRLNVTASAFGRTASGQIAQLAWYDEFARKRTPKLIVLVFVSNDYTDNSPLLTALNTSLDPEWPGDMTAERAADGTLRLRPPRNRGRHYTPPPPLHVRMMWLMREMMARTVRWSYFKTWLVTKAKAIGRPRDRGKAGLAMPSWAAALRQKHPEVGPLLDSWPMNTRGRLRYNPFAVKRLPPAFEAELEYTAFGLAQFRQRADRDGASLVILATQHLRPGKPLFDRMRAIADDLEIPVISLHDHIVRQGGRIQDASWRHDRHWSPAGHRWAAEALLEHLRLHPDVCTRAPSSDTDARRRHRRAGELQWTSHGPRRRPGMGFRQG